MEKNTKDNRKPVISSNEEYEEALKRLKYYKDEYKWITESGDTKDKVREVNNEALKILPMINTESSREQLYYRKYYNGLIRKKYLIETGKYPAFLRRNMLSVFASIMQYKIDSKEYDVISMAKGILQNDEELLKDIHDGRILSRVRIWDGIPREEDILLQSPEEILEYIDKHCNLVGIKIPEKTEDKSLLPAISDGYLSKEQKRLIEMLDNFINDVDVRIEDGNVTQLQDKEEKKLERKPEIELREKQGDKEIENKNVIVTEKQFRDIIGKPKVERNISDDEGEINK